MSLKLKSDSGSVSLVPEESAGENEIVVPSVDGELLVDNSTVSSLDFDNADLVGSVLTFSHGLEIVSFPSSVFVWDENNACANNSVFIQAPDGDTVTVDLTILAPITGTWNVVVSK